MAAQSADTPGSNAESNTPKVSAPKDKTCPYCGVHFTSSSLGRHLDLYIKEKNPKPPDGIHNVEEIRKLRGGITRRQARGSTARREDSTPGSGTKIPLYDHGSQMVAYDTPDGRTPFRLNEASWQVTGVINGLSNRGGVAPPVMVRENSIARRQQLKVDYEQRQRAVEEREQGRAAELALQEVLNSIKAATSLKLETKPLFDFNPYSLSFPALCLRILPAPPTLFSATPFAHTESWTVDPPGQEQFDSLIQAIHDIIRQKRAPPLRMPNDCQIEQLLENDPEARKILDHVQNAYNHWKSLSGHHHAEAWSLETLRAYSRVRDIAAETAASLDQAHQQIEYLRAENDKLSRCQQPREFILNPPSLLPISADAAKALSASAAANGESAMTWDFDRLMEKWRRIVRDSRRGMEAQRTFVESPNTSQPPTPFGQPQQPPPPSPQHQQPQVQGLPDAQPPVANGLRMPYLQTPARGHLNGTNINGMDHSSTPNALSTSPPRAMMDGQVDGGAAQDTTMEDDMEEEEDRDADGEADVDIEDANGQNGTKGQRTWGQQLQQHQQPHTNTGAVEARSADIDAKFLDPKLERSSSATARSMEGIDGAHFMNP
ncbi:MAG: hypothetical protein M1821_004117 [Bathelium mastoideum]|nr:MAG: hypothetical protein M1821_004117 [Bathelium mastoideum]